MIWRTWFGRRYAHLGCRVLVPNHDMKKSDNFAALGQFYGYAKTRALLRWIDPLTDAVKHEHAARFLEIDPTHPVITPGQQLLRLDSTAPPRTLLSLSSL
jgi:hypothetical protein